MPTESKKLEEKIDAIALSVNKLQKYVAYLKKHAEAIRLKPCLIVVV